MCRDDAVVTLPISAIVPTRDRPAAFTRMLVSLANQSAQPLEMIVVDASTNRETEAVCRTPVPGLTTTLHYYSATAIGAACQRNQAIAHSCQPVILFCDDDILFEPECVQRLWAALQSDWALGGVNAMITNQQYGSPSRISRLLFRLLHGQLQASYAGQCIGPGLNLLPDDCPDLPEVVPVDWLNTTCTLYRRQVLPHPPFPDYFTGYSLMEDVTLSLTVGKAHKLANARTARIFHDSQPGNHKNNPAVVAQMDWLNRHYVMTQVLQRRRCRDYGKLLLLQGFQIAAVMRSPRQWKTLPAILQGQCMAIGQLIFSGWGALP